MLGFGKGKTKNDELQQQVELLRRQIEQFNKLDANASIDAGIRQRLATMVSGGYDWADTLHNVYLDFGYPENLDFINYWNMYRRFGIAKNIVDLPVDVGWIDAPEIEGDSSFMRDLEILIKEKMMLIRMQGLDKRQRVGQYAGMFMRVKDNKKPNQPIDGTLSGPGSLVEMMPLYESQLEVATTDQDPMSENYGQPTMYQYQGGVTGSRNRDANQAISIHPSRIVIASEGADNGWIYGISALEAPYNSLLDLRKIIGAGGEGFYKNAAQSIVFDLTDAASAKANEALLKEFNEEYDAFARNRMRRSLWTPGMKANVLSSTLTNPKEFFMNALNDVAAASKIPATILIGQQTGRLASNEDSRNFLSTINSRRANFQSEMLSNIIDWCIKYGILPSSQYEIEWTDLLARSDEEKLANATSMSKINETQFKSGQSEVFSNEEIREAAGYDAEEEEEMGSEELEGEDEIEEAGGIV